MKRREIVSVIAQKYQEYADKVIEEIKTLGPECRLSGDDSPLKNVWEEFKYQIQEEASFFFEAYEETIRAICMNVVRSLPESEVKLLWLVTEHYFDHEDQGFPGLAEMMEGVVNELYSKVCDIAGEEQLEYLAERNRGMEDYEG